MNAIRSWLLGLVILLTPVVQATPADAATGEAHSDPAATAPAMPSPTCHDRSPPSGGARKLAVLLHGYAGSADDLAEVCDVLVDFYGSDVDVLLPDLPLGVFSRADPNVIVADRLKQIDDAWDSRAKLGTPYEAVILVGHSIGSLLTRKVYAAAWGATEAAPFEQELTDRLAELRARDLSSPRPWAAAVHRIVLLAGLNRGWSVSHHMEPVRSIVYSAGEWLGRVIYAVSGHRLTIMSMHRGAPFITQLRLQWLAMRAVAKARCGSDCGALVVQLLGTVDDIVPPEDNVDSATGRDFAYLDVRFTNHVNIIRMGPSDKEYGPYRAEAFRTALDETKLQPGQGAQDVLTDSEARTPEYDVTDVVFVVHGIRDDGYWTEKIGRRVKEIAEREFPTRKVAFVTASYGYFPMLSFLRPGERQEKVEWLMDQYTQAKARYPNATFSYVGHSNGTYLLAKALNDYPAVRFKNVLFAGSVVPTDYKWHESASRVETVFNLRANGDWVVGWFPHALETLHLQDVGGAGLFGFLPRRVQEAHEANMAVGELRFDQQKPAYVVGGHSGAVTEQWWDNIARFVLTGRFEKPANANLADKPVSWVEWPAKAPWLVWIAIAAVLVWVFWLLTRLPIREWQRTLAVVAYLWLVWFVLTEV